ncbi:hypothetical protein NQ317_019859 [Molorchus minor]|uniref:Secreted protein n=1 Tax=Molorchus minor TaxID=1323400 RepID=A0ABQ9IYA9_9CUCU|nr:hypothetical protein NQ317_019859 [Molorchus minor]
MHCDALTCLLAAMITRAPVLFKKSEEHHCYAIGASYRFISTKCYNRQTIFPKILSASSEPGNTTRKACPSAS